MNDFASRRRIAGMVKKSFSARGIEVCFFVVLIFSLLYPMSDLPGSVSDVKDSVVKVYTIRNEPNYDNPWNHMGPWSVSGSGCVITGNRILTNAHIVSDQTFIQVRLHGKSEKQTAHVLAVSHEADLALLGVDAPGFFNGVAPLELGELPEVQEDVIVYGFPEGGDMLSTTKGVISRIEHQEYVHSSAELLAAQIDAAVNSGNSGGPVVAGDRLVGVVMQGLKKAQNISYMVPVTVVKHFLEDIKDGKLDGFPEDGIFIQQMENSALKMKYGLNGGQTGTLVVSVLPGTPAQGKIFSGDVIFAIDGYPVADDGTIEFRPGERTSMNYCTQRHQVGENLNLDIMRKGEKRKVQLTLDQPWGRHNLVPKQRYDVAPDYYIYGGLVFAPLTLNYMLTWGDVPEDDAPPQLAQYLLNDEPTAEGEEVVVLINVLSSDVNNGYRSFINTRITKVNGRKIQNLKHLIQRVEKDNGDRFIEFENEQKIRMVLDRETAQKENSGILRTYRVPSDRSPGLSGREVR
jgi:S1-C subfamily serine protease